MGHEGRYDLEMRTLVLQGGETIPIQAHNNWVWAPLDLIATAGDIEITSEFGHYNSTGINTRENHYEFTGKVLITSNGPAGTLSALTIMVAIIRNK